MLRIVKQDHPFQPVLERSVSLLNWEAAFFRESEDLWNACSEEHRDGPIREACGEFSHFACGLFLAAHYVRHEYWEDDDPDEYRPDPPDLLPGEIFYGMNPLPPGTDTKAGKVKEVVEGKLKDIETQWPDVHWKLYELLLEPPCEPGGLTIWEATEPPSNENGGLSGIDEVLTRLCESQTSSPPKASASGPNGDDLSRIHSYLTTRLQPNLDEALRQWCPGTIADIRSKRQQRKRQIMTAIVDWLTLFNHVRVCQEPLKDPHEPLALKNRLALKERLRFVRVTLQMPDPPSEEFTDVQGRRQMFEALRLLPIDVIREDLREAWEQHLQQEDKDLRLVAMSLRLLCEGVSAVGQTALANHLRQAENPPKDSDKTFEKEVSRQLQRLAEKEMAYHGSGNWVPWSEQAKGIADRHTVGRLNQKPDQGWLVNPLLILLDPVYGEFKKAITGVPAFSPARADCDRLTSPPNPKNT